MDSNRELDEHSDNNQNNNQTSSENNRQNQNFICNLNPLHNNINYTSCNTSNPYNLNNYSSEVIFLIKAGLKWEDGNWSQQELLLLRKKLMYCYVRKEAHWELAVHNNLLAKYLDIPKVILSSILSTSLFVNASDNEHFSTTMQYINAILGTTLTTIVGVDSYMKFGKLFSQHRNASLEYGKLLFEIERLTQSDIDDREPFGIVLAKIDDKFAAIKNEAPFISKNKILKYIKAFTNKNQLNDTVNYNSRANINEKFEDDEKEFEEARKLYDEKIKNNVENNKENNEENNATDNKDNMIINIKDKQIT